MLLDFCSRNFHGLFRIWCICNDFYRFSSEKKNTGFRVTSGISGSKIIFRLNRRTNKNYREMLCIITQEKITNITIVGLEV